MLKKSQGNMYPWTSHTHSHLGGECPHKCVYCYMNHPRFGRAARYTGRVRLIESELSVNYGTGKVIFIEHTGDIMARDVPSEFVDKILTHCRAYPRNEYVFQSKNPRRFLEFRGKFPPKIMLGTTIETNRTIEGISEAPTPEQRYWGILSLRILAANCPTFLTIEPVLDFDVRILGAWIINLDPHFVNIGADSKNHKLVEPRREKVLALMDYLKKSGIELREKHNLNRLIK